MAPIPRRRFRRALRGLDGEAFAALVGDAYQRAEWTVEREGDVLAVSRDGGSRRLQVLPPRRLARLRPLPSVREDVDAVVSARAPEGAERLARSLPEDVDVVDADELRDRLLYALEPGDRDELVEAHLGLEATSQRWAVDSTPEPTSSASVVRRSPGALAVAVAVLVLLVGVGAVGSAGVLPQATSFDDDPLATGGQSATDDGAAASASGGQDGGDDSAPGDETGSDGGEPDSRVVDPRFGGNVTLAEDVTNLTFDPVGVGGNRTLDDMPDTDDADDSGDDGDSGVRTVDGTPVHDLEPNCERGPTEVAALLSEVFIGDGSGSVYVYWQFHNPDYRESIDYSAYASIYSTTFEQVHGARTMTLEDPVPVEDVEGEVVRINATAHFADASTEEFAFRLRHWEGEPRDGCWVVDQFAER